MDDATAAQILSDNIHKAVVALADHDYHVDESERFDNDIDDPNSVADRNGADLSGVDPEAGDIINLIAMRV